MQERLLRFVVGRSSDFQKHRSSGLRLLGQLRLLGLLGLQKFRFSELQETRYVASLHVGANT